MKELIELEASPFAKDPIPPNLVRSISRLNRLLRRRLRTGTDPLEFWSEDGVWLLRAEGIAGVVSIGGRSVEIRPKFLKYAPDADWRRIFLKLVERVTGLPVGFSGRVRGREASVTFFDHVAMTLADAIASAQETGPILQYRRKDEEAGTLRGRLLVERQSRLVVSRPGLISQEVDLLDSDNAIVRLINWAVMYLSNRVRTDFARSRLDLVRGLLPVTLPELPPRYLLRRLELPPQHGAWREAFLIARLVGEFQALDFQMGQQPVEGIVFDTVKTFERVVNIAIRETAKMAKGLGHSWESTGKRSTAWLYPVGNDSVRTITPDDAVKVGGILRLIIDAKYKIASDPLVDPPKPVREDLHEVATFMSGLNCDKALLLYPAITTNREQIGVARLYHTHLMMRPAIIVAASLDLIRFAEGSIDLIPWLHGLAATMVAVRP